MPILQNPITTATPETSGQTRFSVQQIIDKAVRRCGVPPSVITPEIIEAAFESLYMLLMSLSNRGLNLWCVERSYVTLTPGKATYVLPSGTQDLLDVQFSSPTLTTTGTANWLAVNLASGSSVELQGSDDNWLTWDVVETIVSPINLGQRQWYRLDTQADYVAYDVPNASEVLLASSVRDVQITPLNRNDFASQTNKESQSARPTNYWFEKLIAPQITLWPVPSDEYGFLTIFRHKQINDLRNMSDELDIPARWYESICWHLALRLAFEIPGVPADRTAAVKAMADSMTFEAEGGETDSAPIYWAPNIGVYTR